MYPIVTLYSNAITNFPVPAYDRESRNLMYLILIRVFISCKEFFDTIKILPFNSY